MKLIIAGSRNFNNKSLLYTTLDALAKPDEVISGHASGADRLGEDWANDRGIPVKHFIPDWKKYGKSAGFIRNSQMGEYGTDAIVFWDGKSRGSKNMIDQMKKLGKNCTVILVEDD
jgi:hypothetical protein